MKKTYFAAAIIALIALGVVAVPGTMAQKQAKENRSVKIEGATPENPVVYLGKSFDKKSGKFVDGYAIVHYAKNASKPAKPNSGPACYGYLAKGAKWRGVESWIVDSGHTGGLGTAYILDNMAFDIGKWETASGGKDILGGGTTDAMSSLPGTYDYANEVSFAPIDNAGTIAVTYIWGIFGGPTFQRQLMEWDQIYSTKYTWSATGEANKMDFENIATHELGHAVGMDDLYTSNCSSQTMFGYADYGETDKRTLEAGDKAGIKALYN